MAERDRDLIDEQIDYYSRRAPEYDETSTPPGDPFGELHHPIEEALDDFGAAGKVLELACGTGTWTRLLVRHADELTALDASADMLELARQKVGDAPVRFLQADVFSWEPDQAYDVVAFANWLSHVPSRRFEAFWSVVAAGLAPGGRVFFVDESKDAWRNDEAWTEEWLDSESTPLVRRTLRDGSTHRVIKVYWDPTELEAKLRSLGWDAHVHPVGPFMWAEARRTLTA
ncbi:MAG: class I SAM-dependent methyltransferase [Actinomycetota bacterium]